MLNRASTVRASIMRALKRKARSGGSGFCANATELRTNAASAAKAIAPLARSLARTGHGLGGNPLDISGQSIGDGDSDDFRKFVWMARANRALDATVKVDPCFDRHRDLGGRFDLVLPVIK